MSHFGKNYVTDNVHPMGRGGGQVVSVHDF